MGYLFDKLSYRHFTIAAEEQSIVAPSPFGHHSIVDIASILSTGGVIQHKVDSVVVESIFRSAEDLRAISQSTIAHSDWFISFDDGTRSFLDFDDDLAITLFDGKILPKLSPLPLADYYSAALDERRILENVGAPAWALQRFDIFLSRAVKQ